MKDKSEGFEHADITKVIIGCAFEVMNELGPGFLESVYKKSLNILLLEEGFNVEEEYPLDVYFRDQKVGRFFADLIVEQKIVVELKAVSRLLPEHNAQTIHYLKASGLPVGLLFNFGQSRLDFKRLYPYGEYHPIKNP